MSLVGTRPPTVDEWEKYELHHRARLAIKPGLTGMWQVSGRSDITDFEEVVKLDTSYIAQWSFVLDLRILFKTVLIVLGQKQLFVTTHSPFFVNALSPENVWVLTKQEDGFSTIKRASEYEFVKELSAEGISLGDMWYSRYFG